MGCDPPCVGTNTCGTLELYANPIGRRGRLGSMCWTHEVGVRHVLGISAIICLAFTSLNSDSTDFSSRPDHGGPFPRAIFVLIQDEMSRRGSARGLWIENHAMSPTVHLRAVCQTRHGELLPARGVVDPNRVEDRPYRSSRIRHRRGCS